MATVHFDNDKDWGQVVHRVVEDHLMAAQMTLWEESGEDEPETPVDVDLAAPFCGCDTCVVREVLHAAMPYAPLLAALEQGTQDQLDYQYWPCAHCDQVMGHDVCPNAKDLCLDCCGEDH